jgi:hypothetical protein
MYTRSSIVARNVLLLTAMSLTNTSISNSLSALLPLLMLLTILSNIGLLSNTALPEAFLITPLLRLEVALVFNYLGVSFSNPLK